MYTYYIQSFKILASFCSWAGWFESYLVKNPRRHVFAWCGSIDLRIKKWRHFSAYFFYHPWYCDVRAVNSRSDCRSRGRVFESQLRSDCRSRDRVFESQLRSDCRSRGVFESQIRSDCRSRGCVFESQLRSDYRSRGPVFESQLRSDCRSRGVFESQLRSH